MASVYIKGKKHMAQIEPGWGPGWVTSALLGCHRQTCPVVILLQVHPECTLRQKTWVGGRRRGRGRSQAEDWAWLNTEGRGALKRASWQGLTLRDPQGGETLTRELLSLAHAPSGADRWPRGPVTVNPDPSHLPSQAPP